MCVVALRLRDAIKLIQLCDDKQQRRRRQWYRRSTTTMSFGKTRNRKDIKINVHSSLTQFLALSLSHTHTHTQTLSLALFLGRTWIFGYARNIVWRWRHIMCTQMVCTRNARKSIDMEYAAASCAACRLCPQFEAVRGLEQGTYLCIQIFSFHFFFLFCSCYRCWLAGSVRFTICMNKILM